MLMRIMMVMIVLVSFSTLSAEELKVTKGTVVVGNHKIPIHSCVKGDVNLDKQADGRNSLNYSCGRGDDKLRKKIASWYIGKAVFGVKVKSMKEKPDAAYINEFQQCSTDAGKPSLYIYVEATEGTMVSISDKCPAPN